MKPDARTIIYADNRSIDAALRAVDDGEPTLVVLQFERREIESGLTGSALDRMMSLGDDRRYVRRLASACTVVVAGYDADPRELYEIPEVRRFFHALAESWGGWLHFLEKDGETLPMFLACLLDVRAERRRGGAVAARLRDPEALGAVLMHLFEGMNGLYAYHGLGPEQNKAMTNAVMGVVERYFG